MQQLFNKVIGSRQFNFQPLEFGEKSGYHIDVKDTDGKRWEFSIFNDENFNWKIEGENLPEWIQTVEAQIYQAIEEHE